MEQKLLPMEQQYEFYGRHLLLNFSGCLVDLNDLDMLERDMKYAIESQAPLRSHWRLDSLFAGRISC
jgi:hypothetical protein